MPCVRAGQQMRLGCEAADFRGLRAAGVRESGYLLFAHMRAGQQMRLGCEAADFRGLRAAGVRASGYLLFAHMSAVV
jgi:hypothetical protein